VGIVGWLIVPITSIPEMRLVGLLAMIGFLLGAADELREFGAVGGDGIARKSNELSGTLLLMVPGLLLLVEKTSKSFRIDEVGIVVVAALGRSAAVVDELNGSKGGTLFFVLAALPKGSKSSDAEIDDAVVVVGTAVENASNSGAEAADEVWKVPNSSSSAVALRWFENGSPGAPRPPPSSGAGEDPKSSKSATAVGAVGFTSRLRVEYDVGGEGDDKDEAGSAALLALGLAKALPGDGGCWPRSESIPCSCLRAWLGDDGGAPLAAE
jgi:hypothetical protein